ncbi:MAG: hypothetical protein E7200_11415 [Selenomonas ruminantium]|nr:hypothetical protein [Selenomonas ruminantium]
MVVYPDTKVFVACPGNNHTGGVELLHQLCSQIIELDVDACMVYYPANMEFNREDPVDDFYKKYHLPYTVTTVEDEPHNILVVSEIVTQFLYLPRQMQKVLWWLSVDNYLNRIAIDFSMQIKQDLTVQPLRKFFSFGHAEHDIEHWVQSEYARRFVTLNLGSGERVRMVGDYLNQEFLQQLSETERAAKQDLVAYNPSKGFDFTRKLMSEAEGIKWVAIENMTPAEVRECLSWAKVYVDFGNHPGKDRIPREAAMSGCVVITGRQGAAANAVDISIDDEFKFDESTTPLADIVAKIKAVFEDYAREYGKQASYRQSICRERDRFASEVAEALGNQGGLRRKDVPD